MDPHVARFATLTCAQLQFVVAIYGALKPFWESDYEALY